MRTHLTWLRPTGVDRRVRAAWPVTALHLCMIIGLWGSPHVHAASYAMDVDYSISGSSEIAPVQVFDDGQRTYIQFPNPARIPAVRVENAVDHSSIRYQTMAPYIVLNQVVDRIVLKSAGHTVEIAYNRYRAPMLAGLPAGRPQAVELAASQPLTRPVTFYASARPPAAASHPGHPKTGHQARNAHAGEGRHDAPQTDEGPTAISVVSAASLAPLTGSRPVVPVLPRMAHNAPLPGMHGKTLPALPGNIATLPQLHPYQAPTPILALNAAPVPARPAPTLPAHPAQPAASAASPAPILAVTGGVPAATQAATPVTQPGQPATVLALSSTPTSLAAAPVTATEASAVKLVTKDTAPAKTVPASAVRPGAPLAALAAAEAAPTRIALAAPVVRTPVAPKAAAASPLTVKAAAASKEALVAATRIAAPASVPAATRTSGKTQVARAATSKGAQALDAPGRIEAAVPPATKLPVIRLATANVHPLVPALDVAGRVQAGGVQSPAAAPAKPPVRTDYVIHPGSLLQAFEQVVKRYGYTLSWEVNESSNKYVFDYPVTMAGTSFIDDLRALETSANSPQKVFVIDVYQGNRIITVRGLEN